MAKTPISFQICLKEIREGTLINDTNSSTIPIKTELTFDENPLACNECKIVDSMQLFKDEFVEVAVKNETIVKDEYVLFNVDMPICMEESASSGILYYCEQCDYAAGDKRKLTDHIFTHQYKCNLCRYTTNHVGNLKTHMYKHSGEKPLSCDKCDYRCYKKSHLIRHNRTHTLEKPFRCNFCDYSSSQSNNLKRHVYKHYGEKPLSCGTCDYNCYSKRELSRHNTGMHSLEKLFKCDFCDYYSSRSSNLKSHMHKHSGKNPFTVISTEA
ncbi:hypothetical protein FQR65_LT14227 [Abscondita terminalis]|nr:hypothetical protein FQR65_LT14227 [Abscondita terminalis]